MKVSTETFLPSPGEVGTNHILQLSIHSLPNQMRTSAARFRFAAAT